MARSSISLNVFSAIVVLLLSALQISRALLPIPATGVKKQVFLSPGFVLEPGLVSNKYYLNVDFPRGHIALKNFNGEVVDEKGNPIPLHETYLHHWVVLRYYQKAGSDSHLVHNGDLAFNTSNYILVKNSGICDEGGLVQYFGLGSETRKTNTHVPDPYGIEVGNPDDIPDGYEEKWLINVHAIDTRGAEDRLGCTECRCDLYNLTMDEKQQDSLPPNYIGGLRCCEDEAKCRVKEGSSGMRRTLYLRYTVEYMNWNPSIIPVKIFILDITDVWIKADRARGIREQHNCLVEYEIEACPVNSAIDSCIHSKSLTVSLPTGGYVIYGVGHQHTAGRGMALYGEGGRQICSSLPKYGEGTEPGNEDGYIVGMSTCSESVEIGAGEMLSLVSNYSSAELHTGVMGLFYMLIADKLYQGAQDEKKMMGEGNVVMVVCGVVGVVGIAVGSVSFWNKRKRGREGYAALF